MTAQRHILLCAVGLTPQIITETLYALVVERGERIDEVRVITTLAGKRRVLDELLDPERGKFHAFCRDYPAETGAICFDETRIALLHSRDGRTFDDIRTADENEHAANQLCETVRELTDDPSVTLLASVAGGRKTMGIYVTAAMQLFGRLDDRLFHVLVNEDFESHPEFFYIPPAPRTLEIRDRQGNIVGHRSTTDARIHLADIPFVRVRGIASSWIPDRSTRYTEIVASAQDELDMLEAAREVRIDLKRRRVSVLNRSAQLPVRSFFTYVLFALIRKKNWRRNGTVAPEEIRVEDLDAAFRAITRASGVERSLADRELVPKYAFLGPLANEIQSARPNDIANLKKTFSEIVSKIHRSLSDGGIPHPYAIKGCGETSPTRYALTIAPEYIVFEPEI